MYTYSFPGKSISLLALFPFLFYLTANSQVRYISTTANLTINGTSTLHDWTMTSVKVQCDATFELTPTGQITAVRSISFSTPVNALKSEHSAMDNNAYKALKSDKDPQISFTATSVTIAPAPAGASQVTVTGKLNIAGATRDAQILAVCQPNLSDNTITVSGKENISMKDFSIVPPTFMLGTIKTGNDITLSFKLTLKRA
ncbi:MAG TPA: YceI family protein [Puia sp.]|jgi:polyisoprenoid-binding protein YceI|nr:YceI family protein [Puia sp.]